MTGFNRFVGQVFLMFAQAVLVLVAVVEVEDNIRRKDLQAFPQA